ncbi:MAG: tetratricopeptide repeat protein [Nibricoccus sp.]
MNSRTSVQRLLAGLFSLCLLAQIAFATCGGGGGGGSGGVMPSGGGGSSASDAEVYRVSWKLFGPGKPLPKAPEASLLLLWFPTSPASLKTSQLLNSRTLSLAGSRCIAEALVTPDNSSLHESFKVTATDEVVVLANSDGTEISRVTATSPDSLELKAVEKLLNKELDIRQKKLEALFNAAEKKAKAKDPSAVDDLKAVWAERCLFPALGKRAAKSLKKLGVTVDQAALRSLGSDDLADTDLQNTHPEVEPALKAGLRAELAADYPAAEQHYLRAVALDPADPTALRYLGEFYRHQTGQWDKAGRVFNRLLAQPSDPIARAVALHGLGKMTIHAGRFTEGLSLFEQSLAAHPLPITYRNLAVYWFSEKESDKAAGFMREALALDPDDRYNQIFAAVYLAAAGKTEEALAVARQNEAVLEASYNLAAIWAQAGNREKAMQLLARQFHEYEKYDAIRSMEMKEAREDQMFASLHTDARFIELTKDAKNAWMIGAEFCAPDQLEPITRAPGPRKM